MKLEVLFELVGFTGAIIAFRYYLKSRILSAIPSSRLSLGLLLIVSMIKYLINGFEWSGLFTSIVDLDPIEDYLDDIWPLMWFFLFFTILMDLASRDNRQSRKRFQMIFESSRDAIFITNEKAEILDYNTSASELTGYTAGELGHMRMRDIDALYDPVRYRTHFSNPAFGFSETTETAIHRKDGSRVVVELSSRLVMLDDQKVMHTVARDITDRKQAQQVLESEKERLDTTLHSIGHGVVTTDMRGHVMLLNKIAENLTGWQQTKAWERAFSDVFKLVDEDTGAPIADPVSRVLAERRTTELPGNAILVAIDGASCPVSASATIIFDNLGKESGVVVVFRDITDERRFQQEVLKTEKLESLGVLAGGIAHDFNNYLTGILGNLSMMKEKAGQPHVLNRKLGETEKIVLAARELTQQILTFSKGGTPCKELIDLTDLLKDYATLALRGANVRCIFDIAPDLKPIEADKSQIGQVISNMVINASQAMPDGGEIEIRAENADLPPANEPGLDAGAYVKIFIKDRGTGIRPEHLQNIFDPYYTTKTEGSGLGLAVCFSVVKQHHGIILVDTEPGIGSVFTIYLPVAVKKVSEKIKERPATINEAGHILVMDDEDYIRDVITHLLEEMGFTVTSVADGEAALAAYRQSMRDNALFDAVILDLTIPGGMGGKEAIRKLLEIDPEVHAIVSSGYSSEAIMSDYSRYGFKGALKKPYTLAEIRPVLGISTRRKALVSN